MNMARKLAPCLIAVALTAPLVQAGAPPTGVTSPVSTENFLLRNTADLVSLCNAQPNDPNRIAAIHFCQGFIVGIRHYDGLGGEEFIGLHGLSPSGLSDGAVRPRCLHLSGCGAGVNAQSHWPLHYYLAIGRKAHDMPFSRWSEMAYIFISTSSSAPDACQTGRCPV